MSLLHIRMCPLRITNGAPWNAVCLTNNYGLISNCLFLRIIPNGCSAEPPLHFEPGLEPEACMCPQQLVQFWLTVEIEGFIGTYVMTRKYNCVLFHLRPGILLSNHQSMQVAKIPLIIHVHTVLLTTGSRRTRTWRRFKAGLDSVTSKKKKLKKEAKHQL